MLYRAALLSLTLIFSSSALMAETVTFVCDYEMTADEVDGLRKVSKPFVLTFLVDTEAEKAYMIGNVGSVEVIMISNDADAVTFIEATDTGNVMTTTITTEGKSVHSRNSVLLGELVPSQYYGLCEIK